MDGRLTHAGRTLFAEAIVKHRPPPELWVVLADFRKRDKPKLTSGIDILKIAEVRIPGHNGYGRAHLTPERWRYEKPGVFNSQEVLIGPATGGAWDFTHVCLVDVPTGHHLGELVYFARMKELVHVPSGYSFRYVVQAVMLDA